MLDPIKVVTPITNNVTSADTELALDEFKRKLEALINEHSLENICNIPDYMLAEHICSHLKALAVTVNARDKWFGFTPFERSVGAVNE